MTSLMIAPDSATVAELNTRARTDRVGAGDVSAHGLDVAGGQSAGVGDLSDGQRDHVRAGSAFLDTGIARGLSRAVFGRAG